MRHRIGTLLVVLGTGCLLAALSLWAYNLWDDARAGQTVVDTLDELEDYRDDSRDIFPHDDGPSVFLDGYEYIGTLSVPRFGLELPVISAWSYPGLRMAPCRFTGTAETGDLVICGHNYERHFGKIKNLDPGDTVVFTDIQGRTYTYQVEEVLILQPADVEEMITGDWDLTLFTCTIGGRTRVTVRCNELGTGENEFSPVPNSFWGVPNSI